MKHYVLATQQPWGVKAFERVTRDGENWMLVNANGIAGATAIMALRSVIAACEPRYVFGLNWSGIIPANVLALAAIVNFHCTKLPFGRGGHPIENLILRGCTETVMTAHRMTDELDAGPIYGTRGPVWIGDVEEPWSEQMVERRILRPQTKEEILSRFINPCVDLIRWIVETEPEPYPQAGPVVNFKRLDKAAYEAFWKARI